MKKIVKVIGITLTTILLILLILPFAFKGKIEKLVQNQADTYLNAKLTFDNLSLTFFSDFPNIRASLNDFVLVGVDSFSMDTLVQAKSVRLTLNLKSLIMDNGYRLSKLGIKDGSVKIKVLPTGEANWDIMKTDTLPVKPGEDTTSMHFNIDKILLDNIFLSYDDRMRDLSAVCKGTDAELKGSFSSSITTIESILNVQSLSYTQYGYSILSGVTLKADLNMDADLDNYSFKFLSNRIFLNEMELAFNGTIGLPGDDIAFDIKALTQKVTFKQFISIIPTFYTKDYSAMKAEGKIQLDFFMKGLMTDLDWPAFGLKMSVEKGNIQYPALPKSIQDIHINFNLDNPGGSMDNTVINLSKMHFSIAGNPFDFKAQMTSPMSDLGFDVGLRGKLDFGMLKDVYPLPEGVDLKGNFDADLSAQGRMSYVDKNQYDKLNVKGDLSVTNLQLKSKTMSDVLVETAQLGFTARNVNLSALSVQIGKNDIRASGDLSNFIGWYFRDQLLSGSLKIQSEYLNLNDFMSADSTTATSDSGSMSAFVIPKNLSLTLSGTGQQIVCNKLKLTNAQAFLTVKEGRLEIRNLSANTLGGSIGVNGFYEAINVEKPTIAFGLDLKNVLYSKTFTAFEFVQKIAPIFENLEGQYSMKMEMNTALDKNLNPNLSLLTGAGTIQSSNVKVSGVKVFETLASVLKKDNLKNPSIKDVAIGFSMKDGKITTKPFAFKVDDIGLKLGGTTGLDKTIQYNIGVTLPANMSVVGMTEFQGTIGGTFSKPVVQLNMESVVKNVAASVLDKVLVKTMGANTDQAKAKLQDELDQKAQQMRDQAKAAGNKLIDEADKQGAVIIEKAKNPLLKAAAKTSAATLKKEAQKKASSLLSATEAEIDKMNAEAQAKFQ